MRETYSLYCIEFLSGSTAADSISSSSSWLNGSPVRQAFTQKNNPGCTNFKPIDNDVQCT